jgi:DNA-binding transcriptional ArsR family regulator
MVTDHDANEDTPSLQAVLDALDDPAARTIIAHLEEPMTATQLNEACDIPESTLYRKLTLLSETSLITERPIIRPDGQHTTRYRVEFEAIQFQLTEDRQLAVSIDRPPQTADERLADLWSEVREEL